MRIYKKIIINTSVLLYSVLLTFVSCGPGVKTSSSLMNYLLSSLGMTTNSGGSVPNSATIPYSPTDTPVSLPADFGSNGPVAILFISALDQVDRYKSLEIRFSNSMNQSSVEADFSISGIDSAGNPVTLSGPGKGGTFYWASGTRLIFDPYQELKQNTSYTISLSSASVTNTSDPISDYSATFVTEPDYMINTQISGYGVGQLNTNKKDITFPDSGSLTLTSSFTNPISGTNPITSIKLKHMGTTDEYVICAASPCLMIGNLLSNLNLKTVSPSGIQAFKGGNSYYYEITTSAGKIFKRYFGFNYGKVNSSPYNLIPYGGSAVMDNAQTLPLFSKILEKFAKGDYKVSGPPTNSPQSFPEFLTLPQSTSTSSLSGRCIDYWTPTTNDFPVSINRIQTYGDSTGTYGEGYCGASGNTNTLGITTSVPLMGTLNMWLDAYVFTGDNVGSGTVTGLNIPPTYSSQQNITASIYVQSDGVLGSDIGGKYADFNLAVLGYGHDSSSLMSLFNGDTFYFTAKAFAAPYDGSVPSGCIANTPMTARAKINGSAGIVDSSGNLSITIKTPYTVNDTSTGNFYVSEWWKCIDIPSGLTLRAATDDLADALTPIVEAIADTTTDQVTPPITQAVLKDVVQRVAGNVMNSVIGSLKNPGMGITLPPYLPEPLANFPLSLKLQFREDSVVKSDGTNKGIVGSADVGLVAQNPISTGDSRYHGHLIPSGNGFVSTKPSSAAMTNAYQFSQSNANPGLLLSLTADTVTQVAYSLWQNGALNLVINEAFIDTIETYAGSSSLFQLTASLLNASALINILAPGQDTLVGIDPNTLALVPAIEPTDSIDIDVWAISSPNGSLVPLTSSSGIPLLEINFSDLEMAIFGRRPDSSRYLISTARVSLKGRGPFGFTTFSNPTGDVNYQNLNAISLYIDNETYPLYYTLDILEGTQFNPFGLDPKGIYSVLDPLIPDLIVPLLNNILKEIPLARQIAVPSITHPTNGTSCYLKATTDLLKLKVFPIPNTESYPYLFAALQFQGSAASDPGVLVTCP